MCFIPYIIGLIEILMSCPTLLIVATLVTLPNFGVRDCISLQTTFLIFGTLTWNWFENQMIRLNVLFQENNSFSF